MTLRDVYERVSTSVMSRRISDSERDLREAVMQIFSADTALLIIPTIEVDSFEVFDGIRCRIVGKAVHFYRGDYEYTFPIILSPSFTPEEQFFDALRYAIQQWKQDENLMHSKAVSVKTRYLYHLRRRAEA